MQNSKQQPEIVQAWALLRPYLGLTLVLSIFVGVFALTPIAYMREVYGPVLNSRSHEALYWVTLLMLVALVMAGVLHWVRQKVLVAASMKLTQRFQRRVFAATFQANLQGIAGARVALNDFRQIKNFLASPVAGYVFEAPVGLLFLGLIFFIHPLMGVLSIVGAVLTVVIMVITERRVGPLLENAQTYSQKAQNQLGDYSRNAQVSMAMGMMPALRARWLAQQTQFLRWQAMASNAQGLGTAASKVVMLFQGSALLGVGTLFTLTGLLSPSAGALLIVAKFLGMLALQPLMMVINSWKSIAMAANAYRRLKTFLENIPEPPKAMPLPPPAGQLVVKAAAIRAPGLKATIVAGLDFQVAPGQILAVMGPTGTGKSSLTRLVTGLWAPLVGEARLDGVSLALWPKEELGPHLGYLPQDVELFDGSLAQNIERFGEPDPEKLQQAVLDAGLQPLIASLPKGLDTLLGADGHGLSGGQRQRVGLARALYGRPRLLVLDEPNANLDSQGDAALRQALLGAKARGATVVLVTHRREILEVVDTVLVLADGKQRLFGPRDQVFAQIQAARERHLKAIEARQQAA
jgi:ATP-binding cassette subfamily C exporter for protease/lipase